MRKILSLFAAMLVAIVANSAVINIDATTANSLRTALNSAATGDVIEMAAGTYNESGDYLAFTGKEVTVKAAEGAEVIIKTVCPVRLKNGALAQFENVKFDCSTIGDYEYVIVAADETADKRVVLKGCEFYGWAKNKAMIEATSARGLASVSISDCYFHDCKKSVVFIENTGACDVVIRNSTFANITTDASSFYAGVIDSRAAAGSMFVVDRCTFYNVLPMSSDYGAIGKVLNAGATATVSNCIFMLPTATDGIRAIRDVADAINCITYNYLKDSGTGIHSDVNKTNCIQQDPLFVNAAEGNFTLGEGSPALTLADGDPVGDPRWVPAPAPIEPQMKTIYCKAPQAWWKDGGAAVGCYTWDDQGTPKAAWPGTRMALVEGETDVWSIELDVNTYHMCIFTRMNPVDGDNQDWGAKTSDLTIPTDENDMYTITSETAVWGDPGVTGAWSKFVPTPAPEPGEATWDWTAASYASASESLVVWSHENVSLSLAKGTSQSGANNYLGGGDHAHTRVYKDQILSITPAEGVVISSIEITATATGNYVTNFKDAAWTNGTAAAADKVITITPTDGASEVSCKFGGATRATAVKVSYLKGAAPAVAKPVIDGVAKFYDETPVTITCATEGAAIYYTLDGTEPTAASTQYTAAFNLNASATVKAIAILGDDASAVAEKEFIKNPSFTSFDALVAAGLANNTLVEVSFANVVIDSIYVSSQSVRKGVYFAVGNTAYEIYYSNGNVAVPAEWEAGGKVSGTIRGNWTEYKSQWELVPSASDWTWAALTYATDEPVEGCDWDNIEFLGSAVAQYANTFKLCKQGAQPDVVNIQESFGTEAGIYVTFPSAEFGSISLPEGKYAIQGAGMLLYCSAFTLKETVVTVQCGGNDIVFTVYNVNGIVPVELQAVSDSTTWDFSKVAYNEASSLYDSSDKAIKLSATTVPSITDELIYAEYDSLWTIAEGFNGAAIAFTGQYPARKNQFCQNGVLHFKAAVAGNIIVKFSDTGSNPKADAVKRYLIVNGDTTNYWASRENNGTENPYSAQLNVVTDSIAVPAGDVTITGTSAIVVYYVTFLPDVPEPQDVYTVVGDSRVFGASWDVDELENDMVKQDDGTRKWEKANLTLAAGTYDYKIVKNHSWAGEWPVGQGNNKSFTIAEAGIYTVTIIFNPEAADADKATVNTKKTGDAVIIPTIKMHGNFTGSWVNTEAFALATDSLTASLKMNLAAGNYEFGMRIGGDDQWTANGVQFTRENPSAKVVAGQGNLKLMADQVGEYTFTWFFANDSLTITYPELVPAEGPAEAAPVPTWPEYQVKSLYSDSYPFAPASLNSYNEPWWNQPNMTEEVIDGNHMLHYDLYQNGMIGVQFAEISVAKMEKIHMDIYSDRAGTLLFRPITTGGPGEELCKALVLQADQWNSFDIDMATEFAGHNWDKLFQYAFQGFEAGGMVGANIWVDNVFFYTTVAPTVDLENGYYLIGLDGWTVYNLTAADKFAASDVQGEYVLKTTLAEGKEFKVVSVDADTIAAWYPAEADNYVVDFFHAGERTISFRPDGQGGEGWHAGCIFVDKTDNPYETWFATGASWDVETESHLDWDNDAQKATVYINVDKNGQWRGQVKYHGPVAEEGKCYHVALKMKANHDISGVTIKYQDNAEMVYVSDAALAANEEFVFEKTVAGKANGNGVLVFDFGFAHAGDTIEIYDVAITEVECPDEVFYLVGTMNEWTPAEAYLFIANVNHEGEFSLQTTLEENDELKVVGLIGDTKNWYPAQGENYKVDAAHAGQVTIYFRPAGNEAWAEFGGYIYIEKAEGFENIDASTKAVKVLHNGQIFILRGDKVYTITGQPVK